MKKLDLFLAISLPIFFISAIITLYFFIGFENYNIFYPHIDTRFANDFSIENFDKVEIGMNKAQVKNLLGNPINSGESIGYTDDFIKKEFIFYEKYSTDGKYEISDFAWESFEVYYDIDTLVISKRSIWYYD
jgi:hypothetical protein